MNSSNKFINDLGFSSRSNIEGSTSVNDDITASHTCAWISTIPSHSVDKQNRCKCAKLNFLLIIVFYEKIIFIWNVFICISIIYKTKKIYCAFYYKFITHSNIIWDRTYDIPIHLHKPICLQLQRNPLQLPFEEVCIITSQHEFSANFSFIWISVNKKIIEMFYFHFQQNQKIKRSMKISNRSFFFFSNSTFNL